MHCVFLSQVEKVKLLLEAGCDPNAKGHGGVISLHLAQMSSRSTELTMMLLEAKADPEILDDMGRTPLYYALGQQNSIGLLRGAQASR